MDCNGCPVFQFIDPVNGTKRRLRRSKTIDRINKLEAFAAVAINALLCLRRIRTGSRAGKAEA
jgi:hypothetical protein